MRIINIKKRPSVTWCFAFNGYFKFVIEKKQQIFLLIFGMINGSKYNSGELQYGE